MRLKSLAIVVLVPLIVVIVGYFTLMNNSCQSSIRENSTPQSNMGSSIITTNYDLGWLPLISQNYIQMNEVPDNVFLSSRILGQTVTNESLNLNDGVVWNLRVPFTGALYIGQLYPAGHSLYRINMSIGSDAGNPDITFKFGDLIYLNIANKKPYQKVTLYYHDESGALRSDKTYSVKGSYVDTYIEYFPNGTAYVYDAHNPTSYNLWSREHLDWKYPYDYLSPTIIEANVRKSTSSQINVTLYNFEQEIPKKLITILPDNKSFPFGFDGPRSNYIYGAIWLKNHGQRATIWVDKRLLYLPHYLNNTLRNELSDLIINQSFELGIHFSIRLDDLSWNDAVSNMTFEMDNITNTFNRTPISWTALQGGDNSSHAEFMWGNYGSLWRNAPNSIKAIPNIGNIYTNVTYFWMDASSHSSFVPAFTHSVSNPPEGYSLSTSDFEEIMNNFINKGIKIVPYADWYYTNLNTIANITDVYFSKSEAHFNVNTNGYKAITTIYDPYSKGVWFSNEGNVKTKIDNFEPTQLEIITNGSIKVFKLPMHVKALTASTLTVIEYSPSRANFKVEAPSNEVMTFALCNLTLGNKYLVKKDNNTITEKIADNKTGCIEFNNSLWSNYKNNTAFISVVNATSLSYEINKS